MLCIAAPRAIADSPVIITGGVTIDFLGDGRAHHLAFQVVQDAAGNVSGVVHNHSRDGNTIRYIARFEIDCIHFLDDNTVILTGIDVWDSDPEFIGTTIGLIVRDNGEGKNAPADQTNGAYFGLDLGMELTCESVIELIESGNYDYDADLKQALTGNIQIRK